MNTVTIFQAEVEHWLENGCSYKEAKRKAIDYYRKFTARETGFMEGDGGDSYEFLDTATPDLEMIAGGGSMSISAYERFSFNQIFEMLLDVAGDDSQMRKYVCCIIRRSNLETVLSEEFLEVIEFEIGDVYPINDLQTAEACGCTVLWHKSQSMQFQRMRENFKWKVWESNQDLCTARYLES